MNKLQLFVHFGQKDRNAINDVSTFSQKDQGATNDVILTTFGQKEWHATNGRIRCYCEHCFPVVFNSFSGGGGILRRET